MRWHLQYPRAPSLELVLDVTVAFSKCLNELMDTWWFIYVDIYQCSSCSSHWPVDSELILSWFWVDDWWLTIDHSSSADFGLDPKRVILNFAAAFQAMLRGFAGHSLRSLTRQCAIQKIWWNCGRYLATEARHGTTWGFSLFFLGGGEGNHQPFEWIEGIEGLGFVIFLGKPVITWVTHIFERAWLFYMGISPVRRNG